MSKRSQWYALGLRNGYNVASWADLPEIGSQVYTESDGKQIVGEDNQWDIVQSLAYDAESNSRQYSEFSNDVAGPINRLSEARADRAWDDYDNGISDGIARNIQERMKKVKANPRRATSTRTEVRSPTRTSTSTKAYTRGNVTVTGGAGAGNTSVTPRRNPSRFTRAQKRKVKVYSREMAVLAAHARGVKARKTAKRRKVASLKPARKTAFNTCIQLRGVRSGKVLCEVPSKHINLPGLKKIALMLSKMFHESISAHRVKK